MSISPLSGCVWRIDTTDNLEESVINNWLHDYATPLEVEIGFGKSELLVNLACDCPSRLFIGVETDRNWCIKAVARRKFKEVPNVGIIHLDGRVFLETFVPSARVACLHIYFPTPYPDHDQIFDKTFVCQMYRVLERGGMVRIITDVGTYFDKILQLMANWNWRFSRWRKLPAPLDSNELVGTPCERLFGSHYVLQAHKY